MFEGLLSNSRMKEALSFALETGRTVQAYMFCGADGTGKLTAARMLARELVGMNPDKADRGVHPDIIVLGPEKDRKLIPVERIRAMRADAFISPTEGVRKVYIINDAHLMNEQGQNTLLTVLEQPPSFTVFILLAKSRESMLPTVVSRCAVFEMEYVDTDEGAQFLSKELTGTDTAKLVEAMNAAQGNIGLAKEMVLGGVLENVGSMCEKIMLAAADNNEYAVINMLLPLSKDKLIEFLPALSMYIRDIAVYRCSGSGHGLAFSKSILQNAAAFDKIDMDVLYNGARGCENAIWLIDSNVNVQLVCARLIICLCGGRQID